MDRVKVINRNNIPCWYELSFRKKSPAIILQVHRDFIVAVKTFSEDDRRIKQFMQEFGFEKFVASLDQNFGFDNAFKRKGEKNSFVEFAIKIPKVKKKTAKKCSSCGGTGGDKLIGGKCLYCDGKKFEYEYDWKVAYAVSASLNLFFQLAEFPEKETAAGFSQLITIGIITEQKPHGGSLWGRFSVPLARWLRSLGHNNTSPEIKEAMMIAHKQMVGLSQDEKIEFRNQISSGHFMASCLGNACGICSENRGSSAAADGYEFSSHNVDSPMQQITLLVALATLCDQYRNLIKGKEGG